MIELHLAEEADVLERRAGLADGGQGGDAGVLLEQLGRGAGAPFHAVDDHHVGAGLGGEADVVEDARRPHLDEDRHPPVGRLAELLDLDHHVVGAEEIGVPAGRALIDAGGQVADPGDLVGDLRPEQQAAGARLGPLADRQLDRVGLAEVPDVDAVAAGQAPRRPSPCDSARSTSSMPPSPVVVEVPAIRARATAPPWRSATAPRSSSR